MSTFVLKREYSLAMPTSYVDIDKDEMEYADGGGTLRLKISSNSFIIHLLAAAGGYLTVTKATAILAGAGVAIATAIELGTAGVGTLYAGAFLLAWGGVISCIAGAAVSYGINSLKGKTFNIVSHSWLSDYTFKI